MKLKRTPPKTKQPKTSAAESALARFANQPTASLMAVATGKPGMATVKSVGGFISAKKVVEELAKKMTPPPLQMPPQFTVPPSPESRDAVEAALVGKQNAELDDVAIRELLWGSPEVSGYQTEESEATEKLVSLVVAIKRTKEWAELTQHSQKHGFFRHLSPELFERLRGKVKLRLKHTPAKGKK